MRGNGQETGEPVPADADSSWKVADVSERGDEGIADVAVEGEISLQPRPCGKADFNIGRLEVSIDVSNGERALGGDVSTRRFERGTDVSTGSFERVDDVSNNGEVDRSADRRAEAFRGDVSQEGPFEVSNGVSANGSSSDGGIGLSDKSKRDETQHGSTGNAQVAELEVVSLTSGEVNANRLRQDEKQAERSGLRDSMTGVNTRFVRRRSQRVPNKRPFLEKDAVSKGDFAGLLRFFAKVYKTLKAGALFIRELQPWKSYRNNRGVLKATQRHIKEIK